MRRKNKFNSTNGKENICLYRNYQLMDIELVVKNLKYHLYISISSRFICLWG